MFVQNEAGSDTKNYHDEKTLAFRYSRVVSHEYPFPYGFIIGTDAGDGGNVDCFVITDRPLSTGQVVECEPVGLMEQIEDGVNDHNVLANLSEEHVAVTSQVEAALTEHVLACFQHVDGKKISVGRFLDAQAAQDHVSAHLERARPTVTAHGWDGQLRVRPAVTSDSEFIYRLIETTMRRYVEDIWGTFGEDYNRKNVADQLGAGLYSIIEWEGRAVGALAIERLPAHIHLSQIYLVPGHQRRGIGTFLLRDLMQEASDARKPIRLEVLSGNPARRLWEREGFAVERVTRERTYLVWQPAR